MKILLDTHCWLWMSVAPKRFSERSRRFVESTEHQLILSAVSAWEIGIKYAIGKLPLPEPPARYIPSRMHAHGVEPLFVEHAHAVHAAALPLHHHDPFDRMLIAQAQLEDLRILTADPIFEKYDVETIQA